MCVTTNGTLSKANLTTGNVQYSRPQPHVKLTLQYNGTTYDVHAIDIETLIGQWGQYPTLTEARRAFARAERMFTTSDVPAHADHPAWA